MSEPVKVLFASGSEAVIAQTLQSFRNILPELPLIVVSEFPPPEGEWIRHYIRRSQRENRAYVLSKLAGRTIRVAAIILEPRTPHWPLRRLGAAMAPLRLLAFNEVGHHFRVRPDNLHVILRHVAWRAKNLVRSQLRKGGKLYEVSRTLRNPQELRLSILYRRARARGMKLANTRPTAPTFAPASEPRPSGISVVVPSRTGRALLDNCLPCIQGADEIIVVDNGSTDNTAEHLHLNFPAVIVDHSTQPLSFSAAVNRGIRRARYSHVCLLNNDMVVEPGFLSALRSAFDSVPDLFASTAQIFFPPGQRREETGKTVLPAVRTIEDFPIRCDQPIDGEDGSYVLYGSGGCTMYDAAKLSALGGFDEVYQPAYVEDLDAGVRAWLRGWPTVYCANARTLHHHRTTTSKYFSPQQLELGLETNFLHFLERAIPDPNLFARLWSEDILRLKVRENAAALAAAARMPAAPVAPGDCSFLELVNGDVAVFPGMPARGKPVVLVASPYLPFPLSHGAAVRIYNLMSRAARDFDQVLVTFVEQAATVPPELRDICVEVITVRRPGSHALPSTPRPETVEEFDSPSFHAVLRKAMRKWRPQIAQLEFTQMALYAGDCAPAKTILVEHDITYDLYAQMLQREQDWETRRQYERWLNFEKAAWSTVDCVVTMSEKDRLCVGDGTTIANGVDLIRFQPSPRPPDPRRLLFIGSFAHHPNVLAIQFFLSDVLPQLPDVTLHIIAGQRHQRFWDLQHPGVEIEGFVSDVRPAYQRATLVIAPLVASAGTNIKILEAMAMGKAIVSTEAGIHGLDLERGRDVVVSGAEMAEDISRLLALPQERLTLEAQARRTAERLYGWNAIAQVQKNLYLKLMS